MRNGPSETEASFENDPVLMLFGICADIWSDESGDEYIAKERAGWHEDRTIHPAPEQR